MKHIVVVAAAGLSLLLAIPLSHRPVEQPKPKALSSLHVKIVADQTPTLKTTKPVAASSVATPQTAQTAAPAAQPVSTPKPVPQVTSASYKCQAWSGEFEKYGWNADTAMAICEAESSGNSQAVGCHNYDGVCDYGLMQLHGIDILDPAQNISYAYYHKYLTQGWGAWSTYNSGAYYKYL